MKRPLLVDFSAMNLLTFASTCDVMRVLFESLKSSHKLPESIESKEILNTSVRSIVPCKPKDIGHSGM